MSSVSLDGATMSIDWANVTGKELRVTVFNDNLQIPLDNYSASGDARSRGGAHFYANSTDKIGFILKWDDYSVNTAKLFYYNNNTVSSYGNGVKVQVR